MTCEASRFMTSVNELALTGRSGNETQTAGPPRQVIAAAKRLSDVLEATNPRDLDIAVYQLRAVLADIEHPSRPQACRDLHDLALVPVLWRMAVLDRAFDAFLGIGFEHAALRAGHLLTRYNLRPDPAAARRLISALVEAGAFIAQPQARGDWSHALGPAGRP